MPRTSKPEGPLDPAELAPMCPICRTGEVGPEMTMEESCLTLWRSRLKMEELEGLFLRLTGVPEYTSLAQASISCSLVRLRGLEKPGARRAARCELMSLVRNQVRRRELRSKTGGMGRKGSW